MKTIKRAVNGKKNIIGDKIRQLRLKNNLSQMQLAELMRLQGCVTVNQKALSTIELGKRAVSDIEVLAFANCLQVHISELYKREDDTDGIEGHRNH